jgi:hypothetical protein
MLRGTVYPSSGEITIYATLGICHSVWMTVWYAGLYPAYQTVIHRLTNTKCRIDKVISPDDGHTVARSM